MVASSINLQRLMDEFKRFDVVSDDSDHYFLKPSNSRKNSSAYFNPFLNHSSEAYKKIMKEWRNLEQNLPESIYVRVYEKRIDLLRAVIVGPAGTPYHDGLFFFDIAFPPTYPKNPPNVHYRSFGYRINPNLYANGYVCLSLLNTWAGRKTERWNPSESTLLQVLLSIQALVLNEKPYFNEPGTQMFGRSLFERHSRIYNEDVFIISCKTAIHLLSKPPRNFEGFVKSHFCERADSILKACNAYANECVKVGYYNNDGPWSGSSTIKVSENFKQSMKELYPKLVTWFQRSGGRLDISLQRLVLEKRNVDVRKKEQVISEKNNKKKKKETLKAVAKKIKQVLGFKKDKKKAIHVVERSEGKA